MHTGSNSWSEWGGFCNSPESTDRRIDIAYTGPFKVHAHFLSVHCGSLVRFHLMSSSFNQQQPLFGSIVIDPAWCGPVFPSVYPSTVCWNPISSLIIWTGQGGNPVYSQRRPQHTGANPCPHRTAQTTPKPQAGSGLSSTSCQGFSSALSPCCRAAIPDSVSQPASPRSHRDQDRTRGASTAVCHFHPRTAARGLGAG